MTDGYGSAMALSLITIARELANDRFGVTVRSNVVAPLPVESTAVTVMVAVPVFIPSGAMVSVRLAPLPLTVIFASGIKFWSDELADTVMAWFSTSETVMGIFIATVAGVFVSLIAAIIGG